MADAPSRTSPRISSTRRRRRPARAAGQRSGVTYVPRSQAGLASFFTGLDLVNPGVVPILTWHPDGDVPAGPLAAHSYAAMGCKS